MKSHGGYNWPSPRRKVGDRARRLFASFYFILFVSLFFMIFLFFFVLPANVGTIKRVINFPALPSAQSWSELMRGNAGLTTKEARLEFLSGVLEEELERMGQVSNCSQGLSLYCGHMDACGLGCQLHHRGSCLLLSYVMGIPLIHDTTKAYWPFHKSWEDVYAKLGSGCAPNERTIYVTWGANHLPLLHFGRRCAYFPRFCPLEEQVEWPLANGIPIPKELLDLLRDLHDDPYLWFLGQFMRHTVRLSPKMKMVTKASREFLGLPEKIRSVVGLHVRRTDKIYEAEDSFHDLKEYMDLAGEFLGKVQSPAPHHVFLASDDHTVLPNARVRYKLPRWKIMGLQSNETFHNQPERNNDQSLMHIVQDIYFLSNSQHLVCGLTSNVCRLVYEILAARYGDVHSRLNSLDGKYGFVLLGQTVPKMLLPM